MTKPIELVQDDDDNWTVFYFGKEAGWILKTQPRDRNVTIYKALTVHNCVKHFYSLVQAQSWVYGEYH